jgi:hypothetical protein
VRRRLADGPEEIAHDAVEALDLALADLGGLADLLRGRRIAELGGFALEELKVDADRVEGVADLVGDARGETMESMRSVSTRSSVWTRSLVTSLRTATRRLRSAPCCSPTRAR